MTECCPLQAGLTSSTLDLILFSLDLLGQLGHPILKSSTLVLGVCDVRRANLGSLKTVKRNHPLACNAQIP